MKYSLLTVMMLYCHTVLYAQDGTNIPDNGKISRTALSTELFAWGGDGFAYAGAVEYRYTFSTKHIAPAHIASVQGLVGFTFADNGAVLLGGGVEYNGSYQRLQGFVSAKVNTALVLVSGKYLFSPFAGYNNNIEIGATFHLLRKKAFGIGGFFATEYDCKVFGGRITIRLGGAGSSGGGGRFCLR